METDEGGHLIATRFGGSEKIDNIVPMDIHVNRAEYKVIENEWASELKKEIRSMSRCPVNMRKALPVRRHLL